MQPSQEPIYFKEEYAKIQSYANFQKLHSTLGTISFDLDNHMATSLPFSPLGGYFMEVPDLENFEKFHHKVTSILKALRIQKLVVTQAPPFYKGAVPGELLERFDYISHNSEIHHYLALQVPTAPGIPGMHAMELRKLKKLDEYTTRTDMGLEGVYRFLKRCRQSQGLEINISFDKLQQLTEAFPGSYDIFTIHKDGQVTAAAIMVRATSKIAYYYLAGTDPAHKSSSPMVKLLVKIHSFYQDLGFHYLDLGISSVQGEPQEGLCAFKERMGALRTARHTYQLDLY